jgi:hypothetical protein
MTFRRTALRGSIGGLFVACVCFWGCAHTGVEMQRMPDGSTVLKCPFDLSKCLDTVYAVCKGNSYELLYARDDQRIYGSENESLVEHRTSVAAVHCLPLHEKPRNAEGAAAYTLPPGVAAPGAAEPASSATSAVPVAPVAPVRACVPGATQACVGPAACSGGQACLADGSAFGPCDCGTATAAVPAH